MLSLSHKRTKFHSLQLDSSQALSFLWVFLFWFLFILTRVKNLEIDVQVKRATTGPCPFPYLSITETTSTNHSLPLSVVWFLEWEIKQNTHDTFSSNSWRREEALSERACLWTPTIALLQNPFSFKRETCIPSTYYSKSQNFKNHNPGRLWIFG